MSYDLVRQDYAKGTSYHYDTVNVSRQPFTSQGAARAALLAEVEAWRAEGPGHYAVQPSRGGWMLTRVEAPTDEQPYHRSERVAWLRLVDTTDHSQQAPRWAVRYGRGRAGLDARVTVSRHHTKAQAERGLTAFVSMWRGGRAPDLLGRYGQAIRNRDGSIRMQYRGEVRGIARVEAL